MQAHIILHVKYLLFFSDFKQNRNKTTNLSKTMKYEILIKSVQWSHAVPCGWKEGYDEAKSQFQQARYSSQRRTGRCYRCRLHSSAVSIWCDIYRLVTRVHKNREYIEPNAAVGKAGHKWKTADMSNPFGWSVVATYGIREMLLSFNILRDSQLKTSLSLRHVKTSEFNVHSNITGPRFAQLPYILESNRHPFYSFRGLKNQMRIRIAVESWILEK